MNDLTIETLLRGAPCPAAPPELLQQLQVQIALSQKPRTMSNGSTAAPWTNPLRRWIPALAFGLFLLSCVILVGVQAVWTRQLMRENEALKVTAATLSNLRAQQAIFEQSRTQLAELEQLRTDQQDLQRLREEVARLRDLPDRIRQLRTENVELTAALLAAGDANSFFEEAQKEEERIACVNNLKMLGLSIRVWAQDVEDKTPTSFVVMSNELNNAKYLFCPGDKAKQAYASVSWNDFRDEMSSYQLFTTGGQDDRFPDSIVSKCPIHHNYGLADGSVQSINPGKFREVRRDGRLYYEQISTNSPPR